MVMNKALKRFDFLLFFLRVILIFGYKNRRPPRCILPQPPPFHFCSVFSPQFLLILPFRGSCLRSWFSFSRLP